MKCAYDSAFHYNPDKYRKFQAAAFAAYFDVITAHCETFRHNAYTFTLYTKHGKILCTVHEESDYFRVYTICDDTEICYRQQICIDKCKIA